MKLLHKPNRMNIKSMLKCLIIGCCSNLLFSEYRLCDEASPDRALKVGFELLLARALCLYLLQLLQQDQLQAQVSVSP